MVRRPSPEAVVGNFVDSSWTPPPEARTIPIETPTAKMYQEGEDYYMSLRDPTSGVCFHKIAHVVGYQYRHTYPTEEAGGVLRPPGTQPRKRLIA